MKYHSSEQTLSWFKDRYQEGNLEIRPPYQRNLVWTGTQKDPLIETILLGLPVPEIFVQQSTTAEGKTTYAVVDGQQRIRTVLQFIGVDIDQDGEEYNKFALAKIAATSPWYNKTFAELSDGDRKTFYGYSFAVRYLETNNESEVRDMFTRLNRFMVQLNPQELRNAIYTGPFIRLANRLADEEYWVSNKMFRPAQIRRMKDIEYVSELIIGIMHGPQGGSSKNIDEYYETYEEFEGDFPGQRQFTRLFRQTLVVISKIMPDVSQIRWGNITDFYSLFAAIAAKLKIREFNIEKSENLSNLLLRLATQINEYLANEEADVPKRAIEYARAVQKGANDKARRSERHKIMLDVLKPFFESKG